MHQKLTKFSLKVSKNGSDLVSMFPARNAGSQSTNLLGSETAAGLAGGTADYQVAGTNRSGRVPGSAGGKASTADCLVVSEGRERLLGDHQVVDTSQLSGNSEQVRSIEMADVVPEGGGGVW